MQAVVLEQKNQSYVLTVIVHVIGAWHQRIDAESDISLQK